MAPKKIDKAKIKKHEKKEEIEFAHDSEAEASTEEEVEEDDEASSDSDINVATQPFIKSSKKIKKKVSEQGNVESSGKNRKRKLNDSEVAAIKKSKDESTKEKDGKDTSSVSSKDGETKKKAIMFNEKDVHINLYHEAPQNIQIKKIKLSQSLLVLCQMIEGIEMKGNYNNDFAAITFQKKMRDGKAFEFSIPLNLAPIVQTAMQHIIEANPQFFSGIKKFKN